MVLFPLGLIGVYTSFSKESLLDLQSIQKLATQHGFKSIGISDSNYPFWIEEISSQHRTSVTFFPAIRTSFEINSKKVRVYIWAKSFQSLETIGRRENISLKDMRYLDVVVFYCGKDREIFSYLYDLLIGKLGMGITKHNKIFVDAVVHKIDHIIPFHYTTIPPDLEIYSSLLKKFIRLPSAFPSAHSILKDLEDISLQTLEKISYTLEKIKDIRDYEPFAPEPREERFSSLLWSEVISVVRPEEKIKREFLKIKELGLCEFFYRLLTTFKEFLKHGKITSDILSTSFIFGKLRLVKINKGKTISLHHLLSRKPFYVDVYVSSKEKFKEIILSKFEGNIFHRVFPIHVSKSSIEKSVQNLSGESRELLQKHLKNAVSTFRVSNRFFFAPYGLRRRIKQKEGVWVEFCGKAYDGVIDVKHLEYIPSVKTYPRVLEVVRNDKNFITPYTLSPFWEEVRNKFSPHGINDALKLFYISKTLSSKPYSKSLLEELISKNLYLFVEEAIKDLEEKPVDILLSIVWSRSKEEVRINEVEFFRTLIDGGIDKKTAEDLTRFVVRYKNIVGIRSVEVPRFYRFLSYAGLKVEDEKKFVLSILRDSVVKDRRKAFILLQKLTKGGYKIEGIDINRSLFARVYENDGKFWLPLVCARVSRKIAERIIKERSNGNFGYFSEFYARVGKEFPRETNKLVKAGAFDKIGNRSIMLRLPPSLSLAQKDAIMVREEFRTLGFSNLLFRCNFDEIRKLRGCGRIEEALDGRVDRVFGFIAGMDYYGNIFLQDERDTIFAKNRLFLNLKVGEWGIFELDSTEGIFGRNFFLKNVELGFPFHRESNAR